MDLDVVVFKVLEPVRGTSAKGEWVRHEVIFDQPNDMNRKVCVTFWGERAQEVASFREGEALTLSVNVESREFNGKWYTSLQAWRVNRRSAPGTGVPVAAGTQAPWESTGTAPAPSRDLPPLGERKEESGAFRDDPVDDLPFSAFFGDNVGGNPVIATISYLNSVPFRYGIERAEGFCADLLLSPPEGCFAALRDGRAEIALIPVAAAVQLPHVRIVTPWCIGASGPVRTVTLVSDEPLDKIKRIWLDAHSLTSVQLSRILARELWRIDPGWRHLTDYTRLDRPAAGDAFLLIGDKVFAQEGRFCYSRDLAEDWRTLTGLPFVFAVWAARAGVPDETVAALNEALGYGVSHIREAIVHCGHAETPYAYDYLTRNIDYRFDAAKHEALALFREKAVENR